MPAASLPAAEPVPAADRCGNCGRLVERLYHERCRTCSEYRRKHKKERPAHLWNGKRAAVVWKAVTPGEDGPWCECQKLAAWKVRVPISEKSKTWLYLCEAHADLERRLSLVSSWSE